MAKRIYTAWYTPCFLFFAFHYLLWLCLDRSDIPGAAGTLHLYEAMRGSDKIYEMSSLYQWMVRQGYTYSFAMWSTSFVGVFAGFWNVFRGICPAFFPGNFQEIAGTNPDFFFSSRELC